MIYKIDMNDGSNKSFPIEAEYFHNQGSSYIFYTGKLPVGAVPIHAIIRPSK